MPYRILCAGALCAVSAAVLIHALSVSADRIAYPFELSKMEGHFVDHARVLAAGGAIYSEPSASFVPLLYTPLSHHAASWLLRTGLNGFLAARIAGIAGLLGALGLGLWLVARAGVPRWLMWLVPVLFASKYFAVQCFFDQTRPDNLMSLFCVAAVAALTLRSERACVAGFAICATLAFLTKQSSVVFSMLLLLGVAVFDWRRALAAASGFAIAAGTAFAFWNALSGGWLHTYTLSLAGHHQMNFGRIGETIALDFLGGFGFVSLAAGFCAFSVFTRSSPQELWADDRGRVRLLLLIATAAAAAFSGASILQPRAMKNVFVLYAVVGAIFLPVAVGWILERFEVGGRRELATNIALLALCGALAIGARDSAPFRPAQGDPGVWLELRDRLLRYGPAERAWVTLHGSVWGDAEGIPTRVSLAALSDYVGGFFGEPTGYAIPADLVEKIESQYFDVILVANWDERAKRLVRGHYQPDRGADSIALPAFSGFRPAVESFWVPNPRRAKGH